MGIPPALMAPYRISSTPSSDAGIAVNVAANQVPESVAGKSPSSQCQSVRKKYQATNSEGIVVKQGDVKIIVKEWKQYDTCVEHVSVQVLELEYRIFLAGILPRGSVLALRILARQRVVEKVSVIVLPVRIACEPKETRNGHDENARTVKWINVTVIRAYRICEECPAADSYDYYKRPKPPVRLDELVWKEVSTDGFLQISDRPAKVWLLDYYALSREIFKMTSHSRSFNPVVSADQKEPINANQQIHN